MMSSLVYIYRYDHNVPKWTCSQFAVLEIEINLDVTMFSSYSINNTASSNAQNFKFLDQQLSALGVRNICIWIRVAMTWNYELTLIRISPLEFTNNTKFNYLLILGCTLFFIYYQSIFLWAFSIAHWKYRILHRNLSRKATITLCPLLIRFHWFFHRIFHYSKGCKQSTFFEYE
jgi:hypothetical protein